MTGVSPAEEADSPHENAHTASDTPGHRRRSVVLDAEQEDHIDPFHSDETQSVPLEGGVPSREARDGTKDHHHSVDYPECSSTSGNRRIETCFLVKQSKIIEFQGTLENRRNPWVGEKWVKSAGRKKKAAGKSRTVGTKQIDNHRPDEVDTFEQKERERGKNKRPVEDYMYSHPL